MKTLVSLITLSVLVSCKTTENKIARVDKHNKFLEVQSNSDSKTAMLKPREDKRYEKATVNLQKSKTSDTDKSTLLNLAKLYLLQDKYDNAESVARDVLRKDINNKEAKIVLAQVALRRNNPEMASILLNSVGADKSRDSEQLNLLALTALKENNKNLAMEYFNQALKFNPSDVAVRMNMGVLLVEYRQLKAAAVQFERVLKIMPDHIDAKLHLAIIQASNGKINEAMAVYEDVLDSKKDNPLALYNLAVVQRKTGDFDDSLDNLKKYLKTKYARESDNTEVFALIDRVQNERSQEEGKAASDQEIQALAAKLKEGGGEKAKVATVGPSTEEARAIEDDGVSSNDILELEKQLMD